MAQRGTPRLGGSKFTTCGAHETPCHQRASASNRGRGLAQVGQQVVYPVVQLHDRAVVGQGVCHAERV